MTRSMESQVKMCPTNDVLEKTRQQVQDLFDEFLNLSSTSSGKQHTTSSMSSHFTPSPTNKPIEVEEVHLDPIIKTPPTTTTTGVPFQPPHSRLERDGGRVTKPPRPISRGSIPDIDMEFYRKTPNSEPPVINPIPPRPGAPGPSALGRSPPQQGLIQNPSMMATAPGGNAIPLNRPRRMRTYSQGPNDQQLQQAAFVIAEFGDELEKKYGHQMESMGAQITEFLCSASGDIAYAEFSRHMNQLMSEGDTDATNLMLLLTVGKRVVSGAGRLYSNIKGYFGRYAGERYAASVAQKKDVVNFIQEEERRTKL